MSIVCDYAAVLSFDLHGELMKSFLHAYKSLLHCSQYVHVWNADKVQKILNGSKIIHTFNKKRVGNLIQGEGCHGN